MKSILVLISLFAFAFVTVHAEPQEIGTYDAYKEAVKNFCESKTQPWNDAELKDPLLKYSAILYPDITSPDSDKKFQELVNSIKGDKQELEGIMALQGQYMPIAGEIEKASAIYKERMNSIYGCAVLNSKLRIHRKLMETFRPSGSNIVNKLKQSSEQIVRRLEEKQCRNVAVDNKNEKAELSLKRHIIAQTTGEYCNYRHYLYYVDYSVKHRLGEIIALEEKRRGKNMANGQVDGRFQNTESLASALAGMAARADSEIANTRGVYGEAFDAYTDFERNYGAHVLMILIEDRYVAVRDYLRETMNPIGQVIYLASNATGTGK